MTASDSAATDPHYPHGLSHPQVLSWRNIIATLFTLAGFSFTSWVGRIPTVRYDSSGAPDEGANTHPASITGAEVLNE